MALVRTEISARAFDDLPRDALTNVVYHVIDDAILVGGPDWLNHCTEVVNCFNGHDAIHGGANPYATMHVVGKSYDMADPKPRPVRAQYVYDPAGGANGRSQYGPSQVALCLSYYGARNLPSERGRIFIGGFSKTDLVGPRPSDAQLALVLEVGHALWDVGGANVSWQVHSEKLGTAEDIKTIWVDDAWDTQRRRELRATKRSVLTP